MTQTLLMKCRSMIVAALLVVALGGALLGGASKASAQMADPAETGDLSTTPGDGTLLAWGLKTTMASWVTAAWTTASASTSRCG